MPTATVALQAAPCSRPIPSHLHHLLYLKHCNKWAGKVAGICRRRGSNHLMPAEALLFHPANRAYPAPFHVILLTWIHLTEKDVSDRFGNATLNSTSFMPGNSAWKFQISIHMRVGFHISSQGPYKPSQPLLSHIALLSARSLGSTGSFLGSAPEPLSLTQLSQEEAAHATSRAGSPPGILSCLTPQLGQGLFFRPREASHHCRMAFCISLLAGVTGSSPAGFAG